ncbi:MAG TPA: isocitrate lyase/PEP mutase family protein [Novosphingobium sp.]|nr:isocitrate lyase/PEP mutase family protein [Novosphingobium sp.]
MTNLRTLLEAQAPLLVPGVANPLTALVAADIGFGALYVTGAGVSNFALGVPDIGLITPNDLVEVTLAIAGVVDLPLIVDADTGFGNAVNAYHVVRRLEAAGAAAIQLEDQLFPKKCGHFDGKQVVPTAEMVDKIKAAVDGRRSAETLIIARTDARAIDGFEAAIERAHAYREAGADILFVEALTSREEVLSAPARVGDVPQIINMVFGGKTPPLPLDTLGQAGYRIALYANAALQGAITGMQRVLGALHDTGSLDGVAEHVAPFVERQRLVNKPKYDALEARFAARS